MTKLVSVDFDMELIHVDENLAWGMKSWKENWDDHPWYLIDVHFRLEGVQETMYIREKSPNAVALTQRLITLLTDEDERLSVWEEHHDKYHTEARRLPGGHDFDQTQWKYIVYGGTPNGSYVNPEAGPKELTDPNNRPPFYLEATDEKSESV
jgi:hypothetical protein